MIICKDFIFLHLEKCGGNFIKKWISKALGHGKAKGREHVGINIKPKGKLIIGGIRNPFEWYVSCYHYMLDRGGDKEPRYREHFRNGPKFQDFLDTCFYGDNFVDDYNVKIPYDHMQKNNIGYMTYRFLKIHCGIDEVKLLNFQNTPDIMKYNMVDEFYRTENLNNDVKNIFTKHFNIPQQKIDLIDNISRTHVTKKNKPYKDYYNPEYVELINNREQQILKNFNYSYENLI